MKIESEKEMIECAAVFLFKNDKVLLGLRHYKREDGSLNSLWTVPGGKADEGESIEDALRREVKEEVGITEYTIEKQLGVVPGLTDEFVVHVFLGSTQQEPTLCEPDKFSEWKWFPLDDVPSNFINAEALRLLKQEKKLL